MWWNWVLGWVLQEHQLAPMGNSTARTLDMLRSSCILLESMTGSAVTTFYFSHLFLDLREPFNMSFTNFWSVLGPIRWKSLPGLMNYSLLYSYQDQLDESLYHDLWIIHYWVVTRLWPIWWKCMSWILGNEMVLIFCYCHQSSQLQIMDLFMDHAKATRVF